MTQPSPISVDDVMADLRTRIREELRTEILRRGGPAAFADPLLFADVETLLRNATTHSQSTPLLQHLLGDPSTWRLETTMRYSSHRQGVSASVRIFFKRRLIMPVVRWLFEYSRDNFECQRRVNQVLFSCVQELAIETARLRNDVRRLSRP